MTTKKPAGKNVNNNKKQKENNSILLDDKTPVLSDATKKSKNKNLKKESQITSLMVEDDSANAIKKKATEETREQQANQEISIVLDKNEEIKQNDSLKKHRKKKKINTEEQLNETLFDDTFSVEPKEEMIEAEIVLNTNKKEKTTTNKRKKSKVIINRYDPDLKTGLTNDDIEERIAAGLVNHTKVGSTKSIGSILVNNLLSFFNLLMVGIFVWQITVGAPIMNLVFIIPVLCNVTIGIIQEINAKRTIDKLSILTAPIVNVLRNSEEQEIALNEIVIDDLILLTSGKQVPADCIVRNGLIEANESLLTGEADPIIKRAGDKLYSGSYVVSGYCQAQTTAIGKDMYINSLTEQAKIYKKPKSSLLSSIRILMAVIGVLIVPIGLLLFYRMYEGGSGTLTYNATVLKVAGALVGMVPAGLILLTSIALSAGVIKLSQNKTLVQELYCIEMLARVDTLCLDKTGTITDGTMTVRGIIEYKNPTKLNIKQIIPAIINAQQSPDITTAALIERFGTAKRITHTNLIPFSSSRKFSAVQFEKHGTFVIGAPEYVIKDSYDEISRDVEKQALEGYRVLTLGYSPGVIIDNQKVEGTIVPLALIMIEDTVRPDAIQTIQYFKDSNVDIKVISGDNPITASRVAARAGVAAADKFISLDGLSDKEVIRAAEKYTVFGRVSPQQKRTLIQALKAQGRTVAMTGDGVNDILALKEADCSIAMASGSEAATNVSHLVLLDSNFSSMPKVVAEGRRVINNTQKVATLFITKTLFSIVLSIIGIIKGFYPIETRHLIMIELFIIAIPSFLISFEPNNNQVKGNFLWNVIKKSLPGAIVVAIISLIVYALQDALNMEYFWTNSETSERVFSTHATTTLIVLAATATCLGVLFNVCRPFNNRRKIIFTISAIACLVASIAMPNLFDFRPFFHFPNYSGSAASVPLSAPQILLLLCLVQASYPLMYVISNVPIWFKKAVNWILDKIGSME